MIGWFFTMKKARENHARYEKTGQITEIPHRIIITTFIWE